MSLMPTSPWWCPTNRVRTGVPKAASATAAGLVLFALGVAAAVGLAYLTGFTIRFFAAGQTVTAALTLAAAAATMGAIWASITAAGTGSGPAPDPL